MSSPIGAAFTAVVAVALLALFSGSTFYMVSQVLTACSAVAKPCAAPAQPLVGEGFIYVVTTVGGLVSALVIAQLSVTEPGKQPSIGMFAPESNWASNTVTGVIALYLFAWIASGLTALVVGIMLYPKVISTLGDIGTTWLGLAVSAAYAYFGLSPSKSVGPRETALATAVTLSTDDLVLGQKVPNASEVSVAGAIKKKIRRGDPEFGSLVSNQNPNIEFKDEEGTGADRMMTQRLSDRLDALAILVAAEWPGSKLRITEAWDEDDEHSPEALHYEGRAADITTAPVDGQKLGRLGRLAVKASLDWVYFENTAHVHVSVKA